MLARRLCRKLSDKGTSLTPSRVVRGCSAVVEQKGGDPFVHMAVDHQVNSIFRTTVINIVRKVEIQIPALALRHIYSLAIKIKFDLGIRYYRNMKPHHSILMREATVRVFTNT